MYPCFLGILELCCLRPNSIFADLLYFYRDPYGVSTKRDKVLAVTMIVLAVVSNSVALYSDALNIFYRKQEA
jgi:hypothetical protein